MSGLKVKQIRTRMEALFAPHLDLHDIPESDKERGNKVLTRCLAAYAVYMQAGCTEIEAAASVWDGSDDNGIDAVYFDASDSRVILVQSKWINAGVGEPASSDIAVFANGIKDLVEQNSSNFASRLQAKLTDIGRAIMTPGVTIEIVLISTGSSMLAKHGTAVLDRVVSEINGPDEQGQVASATVIGLNEIYRSLASNSSSQKISVDANITDWSVVSSPYLAYFGVVDGLQLKEWWQQHGKRLVSSNIRHSLGGTDVNNGITRTATSSPEHFWYFNNGITLIADEALKAPKAAATRSSGNFQFNGASIVNGAQTVSTLGRIEDDESLGRVRVAIRVVVLKDAPENFGGLVTRTNNLQNRVEGRDFVAQDAEQLGLQQEMAMENIDYQFLRGEDVTISSNSCELIEVTTALACASKDPALAVLVKTNIGRIFNDLSRPPYRALFNPSVNGARAFNTVLVLREVEKWVEQKKNSGIKRSGYAWGALVHGNRIIALTIFSQISDKLLNEPIDDFRNKISTLKIDVKCDQIYTKILDILEESYPGKFLAVLFKSTVKSKDVYSQVIR